jgi:hypothetical protein
VAAADCRYSIKSVDRRGCPSLIQFASVLSVYH